MTEHNPFRIILRAELAEGVQAEFEKAWLEIGGVITDSEANLGQWLYRSAEEDNVYYIVSDWVDEPSFREFEHSEAHVEHRQKLQPYRVAGSMQVMNQVAALPKLAVAR